MRRRRTIAIFLLAILVALPVGLAVSDAAGPDVPRAGEIPALRQGASFAYDAYVKSEALGERLRLPNILEVQIGHARPVELLPGVTLDLVEVKAHHLRAGHAFGGDSEDGWDRGSTVVDYAIGPRGWEPVRVVRTNEAHQFFDPGSPEDRRMASGSMTLGAGGISEWHGPRPFTHVDPLTRYVLSVVGLAEGENVEELGSLAGSLGYRGISTDSAPSSRPRCSLDVAFHPGIQLLDPRLNERWSDEQAVLEQQYDQALDRAVPNEVRCHWTIRDAQDPAVVLEELSVAFVLTSFAAGDGPAVQVDAFGPGRSFVAWVENTSAVVPLSPVFRGVPSTGDAEWFRYPIEAAFQDAMRVEHPALDNLTRNGTAELWIADAALQLMPEATSMYVHRDLETVPVVGPMVNGPARETVDTVHWTWTLTLASSAGTAKVEVTRFEDPETRAMEMGANRSSRVYADRSSEGQSAAAFVGEAVRRAERSVSWSDAMRTLADSIDVDVADAVARGQLSVRTQHGHGNPFGEDGVTQRSVVQLFWSDVNPYDPVLPWSTRFVRADAWSGVIVARSSTDLVPDAQPASEVIQAGVAPPPPAEYVVLSRVEEVPKLAVGSSLVAAFLVVVFGNGRDLIAALYSKVARSRVLDHQRRDEIVTYLRESPGATARDLQHHLHCNYTTVQHHLRMLQQNALVRSVRGGRRRHHFLVDEGALAQEEAIARRNPTAAAFLDAVRRDPGILQKDLAHGLGVTPKAVRWHAERLLEADLVEVVREGRSVRYRAKRSA